ncbi:class I SAM-dependent methyltransferase [Desertihabitans brevis]|uniref:Class I SAM-dependent methyltransferase n=1 Tax=Desertihabitans brevis TaxID=2268447 RepID=A0A367YS54_9ACTN|nr:class I SAM-dependent methyltransferase [Desertihabitans brevis]RCK68389.1 class I SAM-dependent methyltransferase [Desertihabitans brevis]
MQLQPGYDVLAETYHEVLPLPYQTPLEEHAVAAFADTVLRRDAAGVVVDVGCGTGGVAADLTARGLAVVGVDPSSAMLVIAAREHPGLTLLRGDARLAALPPEQPVAAVIARFSLIHVPPEELAEVFAVWRSRLPAGGPVLVAFQCEDDPSRPYEEFDHKVARAWRPHPDAMADRLTAAGFAEVWRTISRPDAMHRFPECHLLLCRTEDVPG